MIGTAAIPITALSAKLISINRNKRATMSHASFGVPGWCVLMSPLDRTPVSRIPALVDREDWTLMGNSAQASGTDRGCAKTPAFNLHVESSSQFGQSENQKCWRRLSEEGNRENYSTLSWIAHVFTRAGSEPVFGTGY